MRRLGKGRKSLNWVKAPDIQKRVSQLVASLGLSWVKRSRVFCFRSENSKTRAYARIWGLNRLWQQVLGESPAYVLEVISEKFDELPKRKQDEILLHELAHIPKNFSGALMPHTRGKGRFHDKLQGMIRAYRRL